jgi:hypothetical protein
MVVSKPKLTMGNIKLLFAFILGWFLCGMFTPSFLHNSSFDNIEKTKESMLHVTNQTVKCNEDIILDNENEYTNNSHRNNKFSELAVEPTEFHRSSSRCEFLWDSTQRCKRPPMKPFDVSERANLSCLSKSELPPPVVALASLPRGGGALLKTALEFATGVRVAHAAEGQCNYNMHAFIETSYPYKRAKLGNACPLWFNKFIRSKPKAANVWGVVVIVRNPYRWLDDFFNNQPPSNVSCC